MDYFIEKSLQLAPCCMIMLVSPLERFKVSVHHFVSCKNIINLDHMPWADMNFAILYSELHSRNFE